MTRVMNSGIDIYYTLSGPVKGVLKVQGSKFLSFATPVETPDMALSAWHSLQREYHDATHHCYAFRLQTADGEFRVNDDGEPAGTAGRQILQAIDRAELTNLVVVVVRYFGGTKLGVGGLSRAYCDAAGTAIQSGVDCTEVYSGVSPPNTPSPPHLPRDANGGSARRTDRRE